MGTGLRNGRSSADSRGRSPVSCAVFFILSFVDFAYTLLVLCCANFNSVITNTNSIVLLII